MDQIFQYLAQHTMAIEQLLSRGQTQGEAAKSLLFDGEREKMVGFINTCCLYISMRMKETGEKKKILWVLTYVQGGVAEVCAGGKEAGDIGSRNGRGVVHKNEGGVWRV